MDFIEAFLAETDKLPSPRRFRRWAAVCTVAAVTDRKVWSSIRPGMALFPNMYVLLVGQPASGKSVAVFAARDLLVTQPAVNVCENSITHESFIQQLSRGAATIEIGAGVPRRKSTYALFMSEWGTFMRQPKNDILAMMADVWDNRDYQARTIARGLDDAPNLFINVLGGCTPAWFAEGFPPNSYDQGLPARFIYVWSDDLPRGSRAPDYVGDADPLVGQSTAPPPHVEALWRELEALSAAEGFVRSSPEAMLAFNRWKDDEFRPRPDDPLLVGYADRRDIHVGKLSVLHAV